MITIKKIFSKITLLLLLSCNSVDENASLIEVTVEKITTNSASVTWTKPSNKENQNTIYKILINGSIVEEFYKERKITLNRLNENQKYTGTIFSLSDDGDETFKDFNFTTLKDSIANKHLKITNQDQIDNFYYTSALSLTVNGKNITNLASLKTLRKLDEFIAIENTSIETLNGIENIEYSGRYSHLPYMKIENNNKLKDILAIEKFSLDALRISIKNNVSLESLDGLKISPRLKHITLDNIPIHDFHIFSNIKSLPSLYLFNLNNIYDFKGLDKIENISELSIANNPNLGSFKGLNNLRYVFGLWIKNNPKIKSLIGLDGLYTKGPIELCIKNNENLSDFCSIVTYMKNSTIKAESFLGNGSIDIYHFELSGNAYNPSENDLRTNDKCRK